MTSTDRDTLRRSYDRSAATYDDRFHAFQHDKYAVMLTDGVALWRRPWLDLGCGTGLLKGFLAEAGADAGALVGIDFSHAMLVRAQERHLPGARADVAELPFRDGAFGAVLAFTVLRILSDPVAEGRTLAEVARVLERGGVFVLTVLESNDDPTLADRLCAAGFRPDAGRGCGQDVGYRCVRI